MNKHLFFAWGMALFVVLLGACGGESNNSEATTEGYQAPGGGEYLLTEQDEFSEAPLSSEADRTVEPEAPTTENASESRKLIKTGQLQWEAEGKDSVRQAILALLPKYQAYISQDEDQTSYGRAETRLVIRVPVAQFDALVSEISTGVQEFDLRQVTVIDVSEEFVDLEARLKSKRELESRYLQLLQKANTVEDMLQVEQQLNQVRSDIERMEGRLRYLENQVSLSTLHITLYEYLEAPKSKEKEPSEILRALEDGWEILTGLLLFFLRIWPFTLLGLVLILWFWNRRRKNRSA
ncbi:MAG: DUF4349 domain-containing protein [Bacteroidota bacterium]